MSASMDSGSLGSFLKGYRGKTQQSPAQQSGPNVIADDILSLFAAWNVTSMTSVEISSHLMISNTEVIRLIAELVKKELVEIKENPDGGYLVQLTQLGIKFTK